jgi:hypothetical protein
VWTLVPHCKEYRGYRVSPEQVAECVWITGRSYRRLQTVTKWGLSLPALLNRYSGDQIRMRWTGHPARRKDEKCTQNFSRKPWHDNLVVLGVDDNAVKINIRQVMNMWTGFVWHSTVSCERLLWMHNEAWSSMKKRLPASQKWHVPWRYSLEGSGSNLFKTLQSYRLLEELRKTTKHINDASRSRSPRYRTSVHRLKDVKLQGILNSWNHPEEMGRKTFIFRIWWKFNSRHTLYSHVKYVPCHHGVARPQAEDGGDGVQVWRVAANTLNTQLRTADKGRYSRFCDRLEANRSSPQKNHVRKWHTGPRTLPVCLEPSKHKKTCFTSIKW